MANGVIDLTQLGGDVTQLVNARTEAEADAAAAALNGRIAGRGVGGIGDPLLPLGGVNWDQKGSVAANPAAWQPDMMRRVALIDEIRGLCVLCMVVFHCLFVLGSQFGVAWGTNLYEFFQPAQPAFAAMFILISGICARFSRDVRKRGFILAGIAAGITLVTVLLLPYLEIGDMRVWFGVIHLLAASTLLFALGKRILDKIPSLMGVLLCLGLFLFFSPVTQNPPYLGIFGYRIPLPEVQGNALAFLGFYTPDFEAFDHFPILPYCFIFLFGTFVGKMIRFPSPRRWGSGRRSGWDDEGLPEFCYIQHSRFFGFLGRQALWFYLLHVPVFYGLFYLIRVLASIGA